MLGFGFGKQAGHELQGSLKRRYYEVGLVSLSYACGRSPAMARKRMITVLYVAGGLAIATVAAILIFLVAQVEDWSRDLTTNSAETTSDAADERLRPIETALPPTELARHVESAVTSLKNWRQVERKGSGGNIEFHLLRTTPVLGFQDDIRVRIEPAGGGARLTAQSRSRVGKGDLGQNPRNLRELLDAVRSRLR
ncbi:MAG TPA: DUF1499 domain-containing protein [Pirellulaceae bacterium]|nr:DUF1499 domain-containing protein [Pirellulaceae bacterium]